MSALSFLNSVWTMMLWPLYLCELFIREWREPSPLGNRSLKKRRAELSPTPLPTRRPRRLTLRGNPKPEPEHSDQTKPIFFKLPLEIRQKIYEYVFVGGNPLIHINQSYKKLVYRRCPRQFEGQACKRGTACFHDTLPGLRGYYNGDDLHTYTQSSGGILPLLQSCRQIYSESIGMVYSLHVFNFNGFETFLYFVEGVIPDRLNAIRSLEMHGIVYPSLHSVDMSPSNLRTWQQAWLTIATMKGLSKLTVIIGSENSGYYDAAEQLTIFGPLKQIRQVADYKICLNWKPLSSDFEPGSGPYRITRPMQTNL